MRLKAAAGWNQTEDDWLRILRLAPDGCFGIDVDGVLASSTTLFHNAPDDVAWVGMVLTLPEYRGRGLARTLLLHALADCRASRIGLDATDMGRPLYESIGFVPECAIERWVRQPAPTPHSAEPLPPHVPVTPLQRELAKYESASIGEAFAYGRSGSGAAYLGPCRSLVPGAAKQLFAWFVANHAHQPIVVDIFPDHAHAPAVAREFGFELSRRLTRMIRHPAEPQPPDPAIWCIAGFEYG